MRVLNYLELAGPLERNGIQTATVQQRRALARFADDIEVVTSPWAVKNPLANRSRNGGNTRKSIEETGPVVECDLLHCNAIGPGSLATVLHAKRIGRPVVLHAHVTAEDFAGSFRGSRWLAGPLGRYLRRFYSLADHLVCPSEYTRAILSRHGVSVPSTVLSNGVDHQSLVGFEQFRSATRDHFELDGPVVFTLGNVFERKGLSTFCRLAERLPYEFVWFGPYDRPPLVSKTVRKQMRTAPENVTFTGWIDDKRAAFAAGDVFLAPAHVENQGIAVLEAMACGKPVVLRDIPPFVEYYSDSVDCLVCSDEESFARAIRRVVDDSALRHELGDAAFETAREHDLEMVADGLSACYQRVRQSVG